MKKFFKPVLVLGVVTVSGIGLAGCFNSFRNPGDYLGGGNAAQTIPEGQDVSTVEGHIAKLDTSFSNTDLDTSEQNAIVIELSQGMNQVGEGYTVVTADGETVLTITEEGVYHLSGTLTNGYILTTVSKQVHYIFDNVSITSQTTAPFQSTGTKKKIITLRDGTLNTLVDGVSSSVNGALYTNKDLTINGTGTLDIIGNAKNGIHCKQELKITDAILNITALNHGIRGNDAVIINNANVTCITSEGDGIQTDNETNSKEVGHIFITDSYITIDAKDDGISAATYVVIDGGDIEIKTNGGAPNTVTEKSSDSASGKGIKAGKISYSDGTNTVEQSAFDYYAIIIKSGVFTINSNDDAIHSNGYLFIKAGDFYIASGDDAIHAEEFIGIQGGIIDIVKCYEGIEAAKIEISGGDIAIKSTDDGINASDGTVTMVNVGNPNCYIIISGGEIYVNSSGDGIDSNGSILISGGTVLVNGPSSGADAALDSDGGITITGGYVFAVGPLGMVETPTQNSTQNVVSFASKSSISSGAILKLYDSNKNQIFEDFTVTQSSQSIIISCPEFNLNSSYSIYSGSNELVSFKITSLITSISTTVNPKR